MTFRKTTASLVALSALIYASGASAFSYSENFESLDPNDPDALGNSGWLVGGIVTNSSANGNYDYFAFPAPNGQAAFSGIATDQGGPDQGANQLVVYGDYNNTDHADSTAVLTAVVFNSVGMLELSDVGKTYTFSFDVKQGNIADPSFADAFINIQKTSDGSFDSLAYTSAEVEYVGTLWTRLALSITIEESFVGETFTIGFQNTTFGVGPKNDFNPTGMVYDNLNVSAVPLPGAVWLMLSGVAFLFGRRKA
ncbi:MAG: hypothetical protein AAFN78_16850 [Pseudomonadota bacterium]